MSLINYGMREISISVHTYHNFDFGFKIKKTIFHQNNIWTKSYKYGHCVFV